MLDCLVRHLAAGHRLCSPYPCAEESPHFHFHGRPHCVLGVCSGQGLVLCGARPASVCLKTSISGLPMWTCCPRRPPKSPPSLGVSCSSPWPFLSTLNATEVCALGNWLDASSQGCNVTPWRYHRAKQQQACSLKHRLTFVLKEVILDQAWRSQFSGLLWPPSSCTPCPSYSGCV